MTLESGLPGTHSQPRQCQLLSGDRVRVQLVPRTPRQRRDAAAGGGCYGVTDGGSRLLRLRPAAPRHPGAVEDDVAGCYVQDNESPGEAGDALVGDCRWEVVGGLQQVHLQPRWRSNLHKIRLSANVQMFISGKTNIVDGSWIAIKSLYCMHAESHCKTRPLPCNNSLCRQTLTPRSQNTDMNNLNVCINEV